MTRQGPPDSVTPFAKLPTELRQQIFLEATELDLEEDPIWRDPYCIDSEKYEQMVDGLVKSVTSLAILLQANQDVRGEMIWVLGYRINQIKGYLRFLGLRIRPVWKEVTTDDDLCRPELVGLRRYDIDYPTVRARYWQVYEPCFSGEPGEVQTARGVVGFKRFTNRFPTSEPPLIGIHLVFIWRLYDTILEELILEYNFVREPYNDPPFFDFRDWQKCVRKARDVVMTEMLHKEDVEFVKNDVTEQYLNLG